jgi:hypothetical protein
MTHDPKHPAQEPEQLRQAARCGNGNYKHGRYTADRLSELAAAVHTRHEGAG